MCLTPKHQSKILSLSVVSRKSKPGQWAHIKYSTEKFSELLIPNQAQTSSSSTLPSKWTWVRLDYIPQAMILPPPSSPPSRPYPGSIVDLLDSLIPLPEPVPGPSMPTPPRTPVPRSPQPFPQAVIDLLDMDDPPRTSELPQSASTSSSPPYNLTSSDILPGLTPQKRKRDIEVLRSSASSSPLAAAPKKRKRECCTLQSTHYLMYWTQVSRPQH